MPHPIMANNSIFNLRTFEVPYSVLCPGNVPTANFQIYDDVSAMQDFAVLVNMFRSLADYTTALMLEHSATGLPLQRPLFLHYPEDAPAYAVDRQYLYGEHLLVAPVTRPDSATWRVYLPPDQWVHLFSGQKYTGGHYVEVAAPLGTPPVFYREHVEQKWLNVFKVNTFLFNNEKIKHPFFNCIFFFLAQYLLTSFTITSHNKSH